MLSHRIAIVHPYCHSIFPLFSKKLSLLGATGAK